MIGRVIVFRRSQDRLSTGLRLHFDSPYGAKFVLGALKMECPWLEERSKISVCACFGVNALLSCAPLACGCLRSRRRTKLVGQEGPPNVPTKYSRIELSILLPLVIVQPRGWQSSSHGQQIVQGAVEALYQLQMVTTIPPACVLCFHMWHSRLP